MTSTAGADLARDGYVRLGRVVDDATVTAVRDRFATLFAADAPGVRDLSERAGRPAERAVLQAVNGYERDDVLAGVATRADLAALAADLLGARVRLFRDHAFHKPPLPGGELALHQDNRYWHLDPPRAVTIWIALDDATVSNGCVRYVPGSHLLGPVKHDRSPDGWVLLVARGDAAHAVPVEVPAGHAIAHDCLVLHCSGENRTGAPRRAYALVYAAADARSPDVPLETRAVLAAPSP